MPTPDLMADELKLTGRITTASNATFLGSIGDVSVVYKPIAGESPLWDFPDGALAHREVAAYLVSQVLGWNVVPRTWLRDGPLGKGMVQLWQDQDPDQGAVDLVAADRIPQTGWKPVLKGQDEDGQPVALVHEDTAALRRMAVFDVVVNNADRKGDHILSMPDGHRHGVDHGLTFHHEPKLRTVLWGWLGEPLSAEELDGVARLADALDAELGSDLAELLTAEELNAFAARCERLRTTAVFPAPSGDMPAVPWPLF
ncbi:SCO1664 family protein [Pseudarthrobacter sp. J1738]|uniref:SCO1664 family protein n=1 Tax=unclassified Pseudarthrobacter TaxID=2647000 RepID=UPI003D2BF4B0